MAGPRGWEAAAHELLVRLAGRLPDDVSWRLRDWVAAGAADSVAALLPRALLSPQALQPAQSRQQASVWVAGAVDRGHPLRR